MTDIFVSYRQEGGAHLARLIKVKLEERGYRVFLDVDGLRSGPFNDALFNEIDSSTDMLVILTEGCLDRCSKEEDWMRKEVARGLRKRLNLIPVTAETFEWPAAALPDDIAQLRLRNCVEYSHIYSNASIDKIIEMLKTQLRGPLDHFWSKLTFRKTPRDKEPLADSEAKVPRSPLTSEVIYRYRLFVLAAMMHADRRWEWRHTEEADVTRPARSRLNVALSLFPISFVCGAVLPVLGLISVTGYLFSNPHAFLVASAGGTSMLFLAVFGRLLWFWHRCCSIGVLLKWAATSALNFEDMIELRKSAQESHFKFIATTLKRIYLELGRPEVSSDLEIVRLPGVEGQDGELAAFKLASMTKKAQVDLGFKSDPIVFEREPGQIGKSSIQRWPDPYDIRVQTGLWNDFLDKWWTKERKNGADHDGKELLRPKPLSDFFEKLSLARRTEYDGYASRRLKQGRRAGLNYCLKRASVNPRGKLELLIQTADYGDIMDSCDALIDEALIFACLAQGLSLKAESSLRKMPWRRAVFDNAERDVQKMLCEPSNRAAGIGVSCFTSYHCSVRDKDQDLEVMASALAGTAMSQSLGGSVRYGLNTLRSDKIGTYPDKFHVVPAGMFGCFQDQGTYEVGDLTRIVIKEMFEEVFNVKEAQDWLGYDRPEFDKAFQAFFCGALGRIDWKPQMRLIGLCFDMLNLRPELCFHWNISSPLWDRVFVRSRRAPLTAKEKNRHEKLRDLIADYDQLINLCHEDKTQIGKNELAKVLADRIRVEFNYESAKAASHPVKDDEFAHPLLERWVQSGLACVAMALTTEGNDEQD